MPTRTEAIKAFLNSNTHADLATLYSHDMEAQVNVAKDSGERVDGEFKGKRWTGYTDGFTTWKPFRIPYNANTVPTYEDKEMRYDLAKHAEGIGMTGWDWVSKVSRWVAFDFDAIIGHSALHQRKLTEGELREIRDAISEIDWATVRLSTSGSGLHIYVFFATPVPTVNHNEHAALARSVLGQMSALTGKDLSAKIDACGQNMWVWHRKMVGTNGLSIVKQGVPLDIIPSNWRDHIDVISGTRTKVLPKFIKDENKTDLEIMFDELSGQRPNITLDSEHLKLIEFLTNHPKYFFAYDSDNNMIITHTQALKEAKEVLGLRGVFETVSSGQDSTQNCFAFPLRGGSWAVRRYTIGVAEHSTWDQDRNGWTRTYLNRDPDLRTVACLFGAAEHPQGGFVFEDCKTATAAAKLLGATLSIPDGMHSRSARLKLNKEDRLTVVLDYLESDPRDAMTGWVKERKLWKYVTNINTPPKHETEIGNYDDVVRHIVDGEGNDCGWVLRADNVWRNEPLMHVKLFLSSFGLDDSDIRSVQGMSIAKCWTLVNMPFKPEYPGNRAWNRHAPQFTVPPSTDVDNLNYGTWMKILQHCGKGLDEYITQHEWCKSNGIMTGADYLKCWVASVFQKPEEPLPYLFFYGNQNSGKSIFHEALMLLCTRGVVRAEHALSEAVFNGELEGAIICVIEEKNLQDKANKTAYNKIKDWVTSRHISIRKMYEQPYTVVNTTHWIQCSNEQNSVPVLVGDTRINMIHVEDLSPDQLIPKRDLIRQLQKEAPDFLAAILKLEVPECKDRMALPVILTSDKEDAIESNKTALERFLEEIAYFAPGHYTTISEFYDAFINYVDDEERVFWTKIRVGKEMDRNKFPRGRLSASATKVIGNVSLLPIDEKECNKIYVTSPGQVLILRDRK